MLHILKYKGHSFVSKATTDLKQELINWNKDLNLYSWLHSPILYDNSIFEEWYDDILNVIIENNVKLHIELDSLGDSEIYNILKWISWSKI